MVFVSDRKNTVFFWIFGFILTFNWLVIPTSTNSPRFTDIFSVGVLIVLMFKLSKSGFTRLGLILLPLSIASLVYIIKGVLIGDLSLAIFGARVFFAITAGVWLSQRLVETGNTQTVLYGAAWGAMFVAIIAYGQGTETVPAFNIFIPPGTKTWWGNGQLRAVGIWQHPNALGQVQAFGAACAISLALAGPRVKIVPGLLFLGILGATYIGNETRSMLLASVVSMLVALAVSPNKTFRVVGLVGAIYTILLAPFFLKAVLGDRWFGSTGGPSIGDNAAERFQTLLYSIELIFKQPGGYGIDGSRLELKNAFGFSASHNSFISLALTVGVIPLLAVLMGLAQRFQLLLTTHRLRYEAPPLVTILFLFFFEDSIFLPSALLGLSLMIFWGMVIIREKT